MNPSLPHPMKVLRTLPALKLALSKVRAQRQSIGFVPTMGYLHDGHLELVRQSRRQTNVTVVSIFVNPLQFGPKEDYKRYPRDLNRDRKLLEKVKTDFLFIPDVKAFYPADFRTEVRVKELTDGLCGRTRPTHFAGVTTVVMKLLHTVNPDHLYLGQKDYQQCRVLEQMIEDMNMSILVHRVPIIREADGLAMSSRNRFLSPAERKEALVLNRALRAGHESIQSGQKQAAKVRQTALNVIRQSRLGRLDYFEIVDARSLKPVVKLSKGQTVLLASAMVFGKTRLIDNTLIKVN